MKSTSLPLTRVLFIAIKKINLYSIHSLSLSLSLTHTHKPIHINRWCWFVLGCWWSGAKWWSFSPGLTLSFFSLKNCPSRSTCFAGWWQCRLICLVWINFCTIGVVFVLGWWLFMGILVNLGLSSLLPTSLVYYMVFVYVIFERENIIFKWNWNRALNSH